jgi:hypothetical protein
MVTNPFPWKLCFELTTKPWRFTAEAVDHIPNLEVCTGLRRLRYVQRLINKIYLLLIIREEYRLKYTTCMGFG